MFPSRVSTVRCSIIPGASCGAANQGEGSAVLNPAEHYFGDLAQSSCLVGHEWLSGNQSRHCQLDKTWTGDAYNCERESVDMPLYRVTTGQSQNSITLIIVDIIPIFQSFQYEWLSN